MTSKRWRRAFVWVLALVWMLVALTPFWFMVQTGFKESLELMTAPVWALPQNPTLANFRDVIERGFFRFLSNSLIVVSISIVLVVIFFVCFILSYFANWKILATLWKVG